MDFYKDKSLKNIREKATQDKNELLQIIHLLDTEINEIKQERKIPIGYLKKPKLSKETNVAFSLWANFVWLIFSRIFIIMAVIALGLLLLYYRKLFPIGYFLIFLAIFFLGVLASKPKQEDKDITPKGGRHYQ